MKNCIITPTFKGHFKFIVDYLKSFQLNANPKDNFEICFTISKDEKSVFEKITKKFPDLSINTLFFEDILSHFQITESPNVLLKKYGKYSFQTLKKFYTMLYLGKEYRFLVLDSESILYRSYDINKLFDDFFKNPFIAGTDLQYRQAGWIITAVKLNTFFLLKNKSTVWFLENFVWFYDYNILSDLFKKYGTPMQMVDSVYNQSPDRNFKGVFEIDLYQSYIYQNLSKYNYRFIDLDEELKNFSDNQTYRQMHQAKFGGECGLCEHVMLFLTKKNIDYFSYLFKKLNFNIIRCDKTTVENYNLQKQFLGTVQPNILAASQDHCWGIKNTIRNKMRMICSKQEKLKKHINNFFYPINKTIKWFLEPFSILRYLLCCLKDFIVNFRLIITKN